jgi:hypothetical protein
MSDAESVVSEPMKELQDDAERQLVEWSVRDRMESMPRRRGLGLDEQRAQVERKVRAELARESKQRAKQEKHEAKKKLQSQAEKTQMQDDGQVKVTVLQNRIKLVLTVPVGSTILHLKERICDGRVHSFRGTIQLDRIGLYFDGADLPDDHKIAASCQVNLSVKKPTRKEVLDTAAKEPADFKVLSGKELLQHVLAGGSLRNAEEQVAAERFVEAMRQRKHRGDETVEGNKNAMLQALQARRMQTAPAFVKDHNERATKHLNDFRAAGRAIASGWQKATIAMHGMAELNEECWDRELLPTDAQPSKRFQRALEKPVPGPIVLDEDAEGEAQ